MPFKFEEEEDGFSEDDAIVLEKISISMTELMAAIGEESRALSEEKGTDESVLATEFINACIAILEEKRDEINGEGEEWQ